MGLCGVCRESFAWTAAECDPSFQSSISHHLTHRDWIRAVKQGCDVCTLLHDVLSPGVAVHLEKFDLGILKKAAWVPEECFDSFLTWKKLAISDEYPSVRVCLACNVSTKDLEVPFRETTRVIIVQSDLCHDSVTSTFSLQETLGPSTNSHAAWSLIRHWLSQCQQKHPDCGLRTVVREPWYPTRLLDLEHLGSIGSPRLIETATTLPKGPYLTLSHCWGKGKHICATKGNLQSLYNGASNLPQTFEDAIAATRNLGYRYLWIDSLCIVQDDHKDWASEAALMHKVYTEAECNLASAASEDSSGGLFRKRNGLHGQCVAKHEKGNAIQLFVDQDLFQREVVRAPLQKRAWVQQEWLMSKRTIHFTRNQVFWECDHLCACEVFPDGLRDCITYDGKGQFAESLGAASRLIRREMNADINVKHQALMNLWSSLIWNYTNRKLTRPEDRLPALAGIANWLQPHLGNPEYLAGIWNNDALLRQLAWVTYTPQNPRPRYRAPSWSWASIDATVQWIYGRRKFIPQSDITDASTTCEGRDPTGLVSGGHLRITGRMGRVNIFDHERICREDEVPEFYSRTARFHGLDVSGLEFGLYYVLLLGTTTCERGDTLHEGSGNGEPLGLYLVLRTIMGQLGTYERCGIAVETFYNTEIHSTLTSKGSRGQQDIPCEEYNEFDETRRIRII